MKIVALVVGTILDIAGVLTIGLAFMFMWKWFVVPQFGVDEVGYGVSCGLGIFLCLTGPSNAPKLSDLAENETTEVIDMLWRTFISNVTKPITLLLFGAIVSYFIGENNA